MIAISIGQRIFWSIVGVSALSIVIVATPMLASMSTNYKKIAVSQAKLDAERVARVITPLVQFDSEETVQDSLALLKQSSNVTSAVVYLPGSSANDLIEFARFGEKKSPSSQWLKHISSTQETKTSDNNSILEVVTPVYDSQQLVAYLVLEASLDTLQEYYRETVIYILLATLVAASIGVYFAMLSRKKILAPVKSLHAITTTIAETKDYSRRAESGSDDEVGDLIGSFNKMLDVIENYDSAQKQIEMQVIMLNQNLEQKVADRTSELQSNMEMLSQTVQDLQDTQSKLVEQEKMASLGSLVAGVAHEINTPLGVAITASSHLEGSMVILDDKFHQGILTKSDMRHAVDDIKEATMLVMKNLERAASLVKSFKMVAVDQSSDDIRAFDLKEYMDSIVMSLKPQIKSTNHTVTVEVPRGVNVYSSPGALSQIFSNLIINSLIHGFEGIEHGQITITAQLDDHQVQIDYFDDGKGLAEEIKEKIFEPFVTTARDRGGSGLGTHILYNLVTQVLGGSVFVMHDRACGVHFCIRFPLVVNEQDQAS